MAGFFNMDNNVLTNEMSIDELFEDSTQETTLPNLDNENNELANEENSENNKATENREMTVDELFGDSEGVGSNQLEELEDTASTESESPDNSDNFYSSITDALVEEGVFPDLSPDDVSKINSADAFRDLIQNLITAGLEERNKRIYEALNAGVENNEIKYYEQSLGYLDSITPELINAETKEGEDVRKRLIAQSYMNKGFSEQKAFKMTEKIFDSGDDIDEAKEALEDNKLFFTLKYNTIINNAKALEERYKKERLRLAENLKKDILSNNTIFGDIEIDKNTRLKVVDNIMKPTYKHPETGNYYTALLKYEMENRDEYIKNVGLLFTLTDGFKDLGRLVKPSAKKEVKAKLAELESKLNNTRRSTGKMKFVSQSDNNAKVNIFDKGYTLDF